MQLRVRLFPAILLTLSAPVWAQWVNLKTAGIPRTADGKANLTAPAPRAPDGHPDLQGVWSFATLTPLERPADLAGKATLTKEEAAEYAKKRIERDNRDSRAGGNLADVSRVEVLNRLSRLGAPRTTQIPRALPCNQEDRRRLGVARQPRCGPGNRHLRRAAYR